jgi:hypothetical protein
LKEIISKVSENVLSKKKGELIMIEHEGKANMAEVEEMEKFLVSRVIGHMYMFLTKPVFEQFGMEGEKAIRKGLRTFGKFRGERIRKWHEEEGLPKNLESLMKFWDILSLRGCGGENPDLVITPYFGESITTHCPLHDVCREANFEHYGYVYCDEIHHEVVMAYHPKAIVEIHEDLMKGDAGCHFKFMMPQEMPEEQIDKSGLKALEKRVKENPVEFIRLMLKREGHVVGMLYHSISQAVIERFGQDGRAIVKSSLLEMGKKRGIELKEKLKKARIETTWGNICDHFDLAYKYAWEIHREDTSDDRLFVADVEYCPLAEIWNELGDRELGPIYCDNMYTAMFKELNGKAKIKIPQCISKGASKCRFEFKI